jgi:hypothetical protein
MNLGVSFRIAMEGYRASLRQDWQRRRHSSLSQQVAFERSSDPRSAQFNWVYDGGGGGPVHSAVAAVVRAYALATSFDKDAAR